MINKRDKGKQKFISVEDSFGDEDESQRNKCTHKRMKHEINT